jgi:hypothetical protein
MMGSKAFLYNLEIDFKWFHVGYTTSVQNGRNFKAILALDQCPISAGQEGSGLFLVSKGNHDLLAIPFDILPIGLDTWECCRGDVGEEMLLLAET